MKALKLKTIRISRSIKKEKKKKVARTATRATTAAHNKGRQF